MTDRRTKVAHGEEEGAFRNWLRERLKGTLWVTRPVRSDEQLEEMAYRIGLDPDFLAEVRAEVILERASAGHSVDPMAHFKKGGKGYQLEIELPEAFWGHWQTFIAAHGGGDQGVVLRAVIHTYLLGEYEPFSVPRGFELWGVKLPPLNQTEWEKRHGRKYPYRARAAVPQGVRRALVIRARRHQAKPPDLVGALLRDCIEGRFLKHERVLYVTMAQMFDDETKYNLRGGKIG